MILGGKGTKNGEHFNNFYKKKSCFRDDEYLRLARLGKREVRKEAGS